VRAVRGHELEFGIVGSLGAAPEIDGAALEDEIVLVGGPELTRRRLTPTLMKKLTWVTGRKARRPERPWTPSSRPWA
jgi:hypothetical protein